MNLSYKTINQLHLLAVNRGVSYDEILIEAVDAYYQNNTRVLNLNEDLNKFVEINCNHPIANNPSKGLVCKTCAIQWAIERRKL